MVRLGTPIGFILAPSWPLWAPFSLHFGPSWVIFGQLGAKLGPTWANLGPTWANLRGQARTEKRRSLARQKNKKNFKSNLRICQKKIRTSSQNGSRTGPQNGAKILPKSSQNDAKIVPKSLQNRPRTGPQERWQGRLPFSPQFSSFLAPSWAILGVLGPPLSALGPSLDALGPFLDGSWRPEMDQKWSQNRSKDRSNF